MKNPPKMTKAHFEFIAEMLRTHIQVWPGKSILIERLAVDFAAELERTNPAFDRERFLKACGVEK